MPDLPDLDLQRETPQNVDGNALLDHRWKVPALLFAVLVMVVSAAAYIVYSGRRPTPPAVAGPKSVANLTSVERPIALGGQPEEIAVPALDESDSVVRELVRKLSADPAVIAWLTSKSLIRTFTVVVVNIADGASPAKHLAVLRPASPFRTTKQQENYDVDPRSYDRYAALANAVASIDPPAAAKLYATLRPRIREAYRDLGLPDPSFDHTLERAIVALLKTPTVEGTVRLTPKGIGYAFADERLEGMSAAQKHLLRMGPHNGRIFKEQLRAIAEALGIPEGNLPPA
jgi:hypothetical protein